MRELETGSLTTELGEIVKVVCLRRLTSCIDCIFERLIRTFRDPCLARRRHKRPRSADSRWKREHDSMKTRTHICVGAYLYGASTRTGKASTLAPTTSLTVLRVNFLRSSRSVYQEKTCVYPCVVRQSALLHATSL